MAVAAGVDEISHLPSAIVVGEDGAATLLSAPDAKSAARRRVVSILTVGAYADAGEVNEYELRNIRLLRRHGARFAIGSNSFGSTPLEGTLLLAGTGAFPNAELLRIWSEDSALTIFPERRIGRLREGHEASFLVLGSDPLEDFEAVRDIRTRVKNGRPLAASG